MNTLTPSIAQIDVSDIHDKAIQAAREAEADFIAKYGNPGYCGFAWVEVYGVRSNSKLGKALQSVGFRKSYTKNLQLWNPGGSPTQSMDIKESGAVAYANILRSHGINAYVGSRPD